LAENKQWDKEVLEYLPLCKKMGSTHIRNQERKLGLMFPKSNSVMNEDEKTQYKEYLKSLPSVHRKE
jgi:hypothetical protein